MPSFYQCLSVAAVLAVASAQGPGVILSAQGTPGSPASYGLQVNLTDPADANIMDANELMPNFFNECGRTLLAGNLDSGGTTEDVLALKAVTAVTKSSKVAMVVNEGDPTKGAGPYICDLDPTSNSLTFKGQTPLKVTGSNTATGGKIMMDVEMPANLTCVGGSPGNVCLIRCFNQAHYGGCVAIQQTDVTPTVNDPNTIKTASTLDAIQKQISNNQKDIKTTMQNERLGADDTTKGVKVADALLTAHQMSVTEASPPGAAAPAAAANDGTTKKKGKGQKATRSPKGKGKSKKKGKGAAAAAAAPAAAKAVSNAGTNKAAALPTTPETQVSSLLTAAGKRALNFVA